MNCMGCENLIQRKIRGSKWGNREIIKSKEVLIKVITQEYQGNLFVFLKKHIFIVSGFYTLTTLHTIKDRRLTASMRWFRI